MKGPGCFGSSCRKPNVLLALRNETRAAGREGLVWQCWRQIDRCRPLPIRSAVIGGDQLELSIDRLAAGHTVGIVPKGHRIKKSGWLRSKRNGIRSGNVANARGRFTRPRAARSRAPEVTRKAAGVPACAATWKAGRRGWLGASSADARQRRRRFERANL